MMAEADDFEALERVRRSKERAEALDWRKVQELRRSNAFTPLDWQRLNDPGFVETSPNEGSGEKRTVFKRADTVELLYREERLTDEQYRAAQKIRWVVIAVQRGMVPGATIIDGTRVDGHGAYADPLEKMGWKAAEEYDTAYKPWAVICSNEYHAGRNGRFSWFSLVIDVVIENKSLSMVDLYRGIRKGTAKRVLREALDIYGRRGNMEQARSLAFRNPSRLTPKRAPSKCHK